VNSTTAGRSPRRPGSNSSTRSAACCPEIATTASTRRKIFEDVALGDDFPEFLTLPAYELID
jgi:hypothetical protein